MEETINMRVRRYRKKAGYTQGRLGELLGLKTSTYSQMERKGNITCNTLLKLSKILKVDATTLLFGENSESEEEPKPTEKPIENGYWHTVEITNRELNIIKVFRNLSEKKKREFCENTFNLTTKGKR